MEKFLVNFIQVDNNSIRSKEECIIEEENKKEVLEDLKTYQFFSKLVSIEQIKE